MKLSPDFYARDFGKIIAEVIQHLSDVDGLQLEVRLGIAAFANNGFDEAKIRTTREICQTMKFEQSGFEAEGGSRLQAQPMGECLRNRVVLVQA